MDKASELYDKFLKEDSLKLKLSIVVDIVDIICNDNISYFKKVIDTDSEFRCAVKAAKAINKVSSIGHTISVNSLENGSLKYLTIENLMNSIKYKYVDCKDDESTVSNINDLYDEISSLLSLKNEKVVSKDIFLSNIKEFGYDFGNIGKAKLDIPIEVVERSITIQKHRNSIIDKVLENN